MSFKISCMEKDILRKKIFSVRQGTAIARKVTWSRLTYYKVVAGTDNEGV